MSLIITTVTFDPSFPGINHSFKPSCFTRTNHKGSKWDLLVASNLNSVGNSCNGKPQLCHDTCLFNLCPADTQK